MIKYQKGIQVFTATTAQNLMDMAGKALETDFTKISRVISRRKINQILHFTHISNLESILKIGLSSKAFLNSNQIEFFDTDKQRLDGLLNGFSCSLTIPNLFMLKMKESSIGKEFVVIEISANALLTSKFVAFPGNAATSTINNDAKDNPSQYIGAAGLRNLFLNENERRLHSRADSEATDLQSEIIFFDQIFPDRIRAIHTPSYLNAGNLHKLRIILSSSPEIEFCNTCNHGYFANNYHKSPSFNLDWKTN